WTAAIYEPTNLRTSPDQNGSATDQTLAAGIILNSVDFLFSARHNFAEYSSDTKEGVGARPWRS
ncbi:hypothetical protein PgNI_10226, partial [Pyricularia grisea]|uniref:Uncharacterized protein n=1 Tax=Pyricularia grisea TaxID=148305 RepID=A0A6P8AZM2_PYRGI